MERLFKEAEGVLRALVGGRRMREAKVILRACTDLYLSDRLPSMLVGFSKEGGPLSTEKKGAGGGGMACEWVRRRLAEAGPEGVPIAELEEHMRTCPLCRRIKAQLKRAARRKLGVLLMAYRKGSGH